MRKRLMALMTIVAFVTVVGCGAPDPEFDNEGDRAVECMVHQSEPPGDRYLDREQRDTGDVLTVMKYYTANGAKPYCDGAPPTDADRAWGELYVDLDGPAERVRTVLG